MDLEGVAVDGEAAQSLPLEVDGEVAEAFVGLLELHLAHPYELEVLLRPKFRVDILGVERTVDMRAQSAAELQETMVDVEGVVGDQHFGAVIRPRLEHIQVHVHQYLLVLHAVLGDLIHLLHPVSILLCTCQAQQYSHYLACLHAFLSVVLDSQPLNFVSYVRHNYPVG